MLGCLTGPLVASAVASANPSHWYLFYLFPLGLCSINVIATVCAFRSTVVLKRSHSIEPQGESSREVKSSRNKRAVQEIQQTMKVPSVWLLSMYYFFFLGFAITAGGRCYCRNTWLQANATFRLGGDISYGGAQRESGKGWVCTIRLLWWWLLGTTAACRTHIQVRRTSNDFCLYHRLSRVATVFLVVRNVSIPTGFLRLIKNDRVPNIIADAVVISLIGFFSGPFFATASPDII